MENSYKNIIEWNPIEFLDKNFDLKTNYAILILNRPILIENNLFIKLWNYAKVRITVDGGTNRWITYKNLNKINELKNPDFVSGDFDSITTESINFIKKINVDIKSTPDQNETDFTKALRVLKPSIEKHKIISVIAIAENSGRLDQIMANINSLYKAKTFLPNTDIFLMTSTSLSWLLVPGAHKIEIPKFIKETKRWCSLIPLSDVALVSTTGLKWNLNNNEIKFGGIVSTSNTYSEDKTNSVAIETDRIILWSMGTFKSEHS